ncbi:hypothetical protein CAR_c09060 [Carnobacterium sp. 17-4]|uniref:hypothetical protein n=1 Tax=Carnobacterium sp. (strain 17-4) TaxID=208596 RepID=UPI0002058CED|nr:hypothetical protein [Carnobacterium sp. 17-4]AEB29599.1 hypothetical protein CAR_c09060 [Carnobacterium sp. 17-4]
MIEKIFFDNLGNFQWASIAAMISSLAFVTSLISISITIKQGEKNRKTSSLAALRIDELKEVRKNVSEIVNSLHNLQYMEDFANKRQNMVKIPEKFTIHKNEIYALLYREEKHSKEFIQALILFEGNIINTENMLELPNLLDDFDAAAKDYSKKEYKEIENYI